jgi:valyl-tRNA synthetase
MYDFIWRDFCDWYLEAIKPTVRDDPAQQQVLRRVLNAALRLLHPICPFVTEALWPTVQATGTAGIDGVTLPDSEQLAAAAWPDIACRIHDQDAINTFERIRSLVLAIRGIRAQYNVDPKKKIALSVTPAARELIGSTGGAVQTLCCLESVRPMDGARPADAIPLSFEGEELILSGLMEGVDLEAERKRLNKLIAEKEKAVAGYSKKLANPGYVNNAPAAVVEETRNRLGEAEADLAAAQSSLAALGAAGG